MLARTRVGLTETSTGEIITFRPAPRRVSHPKRYKRRPAPKDTFWQAVALTSLLTALIITTN